MGSTLPNRPESVGTAGKVDFRALEICPDRFLAVRKESGPRARRFFMVRKPSGPRERSFFGRKIVRPASGVIPDGPKTVWPAGRRLFTVRKRSGRGEGHFL